MNILPNYNNMSFTSITPIIAKKGTLGYFKTQLANSKKSNCALIDVTNFCAENVEMNPIFGWAKYKSREIGILITGDEFKNCKLKLDGWRSKRDVLKHIDRTPMFITNNSKTSIDFLIKRVDAFSVKK